MACVLLWPPDVINPEKRTTSYNAERSAPAYSHACQLAVEFLHDVSPRLAARDDLKKALNLFVAWHRFFVCGDRRCRTGRLHSQQLFTRQAKAAVQDRDPNQGLKGCLCDRSVFCLFDAGFRKLCQIRPANVPIDFRQEFDFPRRLFFSCKDNLPHRFLPLFP